MICRADNLVNGNIEVPSIEVPIENYAQKLIHYLDIYLNQIDREARKVSPSGKAAEKAKIILRWNIFPNDKEFQKDLRRIQNDIGPKTRYIVLQYTKCIMQLLGKIAECVIVDRCNSNPDFNEICMNIALFKPDIYLSYSDISYRDYFAFSTSFKIFFYKDLKSGLYIPTPTPDYNPHHTTKDIGWCKRSNILSQLRVSIRQWDYENNAKLQVKTTINCANLNLEQYPFTPVICFDLDNNIAFLRQKYPGQVIFSGREIAPDAELEIEKYFQILGAYAAGLTDHINLSERELIEDTRLRELFRTPVNRFLQQNDLDKAGIIELIERLNKPILIGA